MLDENKEFTQIDDIAVSTRVRIARNIDQYRFPQSMNLKDSDDMTNSILNIMKASKDKYEFHRVKDLDDSRKISLMEDHIISPSLIEASLRGSFLMREDRKVTIMINEEDHLRIQVLLPGMKMEEAWEIASNIDDFIEEDVDYSFHERFGYLTACPTNVGTGLRASVMLHLPALTMTNHIDSMADTLRKIGLTLRGTYGEGSQGLGCLYQISNQTTLGQSEEEIIVKLNRVIRQIISREKATRIYLSENKAIDLEDRVIRSYGLVRNNRKISSQEAMMHLSNIKLGADLGLIELEDANRIIQLMIDIQPAKLQCKLGEKLDKEKRDIIRSQKLREFFIE